MPDGEHQFVNIALAGVRSARVSSKQGESSEQWGEEAKFFTESRLLQRPVRVQILSLPTSSVPIASPFQNGGNDSANAAAAPASIFIGTGGLLNTCALGFMLSFLQSCTPRETSPSIS